MYNVHMQKRYTVAEARKNLSELLTVAESGEVVVIERRGVRYTLRAAKPTSTAKRRNVVAESDAAVEAGNYTWDAGEGGLAFAPRQSK